MTTSEPSQQPLFEVGSEEEAFRSSLWRTPAAYEAQQRPSVNNTLNRLATGKQVSLSQQSQLVSTGLISSPQVTPANHSVQPGSDWARKMTAISGQQLLPSLASSGPVGACLRTLLVTSAWASTTCYLTWKRSITPAGRWLFRLVPSTPRTGATGFGFWPTAQASPNQNRDTKPKPSAINGTHGWSLAGAVHDAQSPEPHRMWPTPRMEGFDAGSHRGNPDSLHAAVKLLPTPKHRDGAHNRGRPTDLPNHVNGKLSAAWVTRLQGYPDGWLDLES